MVDQHDLRREQDRTDQKLPLAAGQAQRVAPGQTEQIQPHDAGRDTAPQLDAGAAAQENPRHRHQHNVERRHKARLGRAGRANAHLLRGGRRKQRHTAENTAAQQHFFVLPEARLRGGVRFAHLAQHGHQAQQKRTGQPAAAGQKRVRAHIIAADALCDKGRAPDECAGHKHQRVAQLFFIHSVKSSLVVQPAGQGCPLSVLFVYTFPAFQKIPPGHLRRGRYVLSAVCAFLAVGVQLFAAQPLDLEAAGDIVLVAVIVADRDLVLLAWGQACDIVLVGAAVRTVVDRRALHIAGAGLVVAQLPERDLKVHIFLAAGLGRGAAGHRHAVAARHEILGGAVGNAVKRDIQRVLYRVGHNAGRGGVHLGWELHAAAGGRFSGGVGVILVGFLDQAQLVDQMHDHILGDLLRGAGRQTDCQQHGHCQCRELAGKFHIADLRGCHCKNTQPIIPQFSAMYKRSARFYTFVFGCHSLGNTA